MPEPPRSLEVLARTCGVRARGLARALVGEFEMAEDVLQEAYLRAARIADRIPPADPWP